MESASEKSVIALDVTQIAAQPGVVLHPSVVIAEIRRRNIRQADVQQVLAASQASVSRLMNAERQMKAWEAVKLSQWLGLDESPSHTVPSVNALTEVLRQIVSHMPGMAGREAWLSASAQALQDWIEEHRTDPVALDEPNQAQRSARALMRQAARSLGSKAA